VSEVFDTGNLNRTASSTVSNFSDSDVRFLGRSPEPDKAKQIMGLHTNKPLPSRKFIGDGGNIAALENGYPDIHTTKKNKGKEPAKGNGLKENGITEKHSSIDEDRVKETARDIYNGTELLVSLNEAAGWLMNTNEFNIKVRTAYMELYDFMGLDVLTAVRYIICSIGLILAEYVDVCC